MEQIILAIILYILGAAGRTSYGFTWKKLKDPEMKFDQLYWFTMLISILFTVLASPVAYINVIVPIGSELYIIITSACMGYAVNDAFNRPVSFLLGLVMKKKQE